jgi:glycerate kinase
LQSNTKNIKIVIATQSYKGSLSAQKVAEAIDRGLRRVLKNVITDIVPLADGGEGTLDAMIYSTKGKIIKEEVMGPLGQSIEAGWGVLGDESTAVIEMAQASGITRVSAQNLNPLIATSYGTGQLIKAALDANCRKIIIGLGGSATNDGGAGMVVALGAKLIDKNGFVLPLGGGALSRLERIDISDLDKRLSTCRIIAACDVRNSLCGREGATMVYGPQKGASPEMCDQLEEALSNYARVIKKDLGFEVNSLPGAGAAGGTAAGLVAFMKAELKSGFEILSEAVDLRNRLQGAALVFTGEGRIDNQTFFGKTVAGVASLAKSLQIPVVAIVGQVAGDIRTLNQQGVDVILSISPGPISLNECIAYAEKFIEDVVEQAARLIQIDLHDPTGNNVI